MWVLSYNPQGRTAHLTLFQVSIVHSTLTQLLSNMISPASAGPDASRIADDQLAVYLSGRREDDVIMWVLLLFSPVIST